MSNQLYEEKYWKERGSIEQKHYWQVLKWLQYLEPKTVLDVGCGRGEYIHAFRHYGINAEGYDISKHAAENAYGLAQGHVSNSWDRGRKYDLVVCYDVLEHLNLDEVPPFISKLVQATNQFVLCSICTYDDPNYALDDTHKTARSRAWWEYQFKKESCQVIPLPQNWLFKHQMFLFRRMQNG